MGTSTLLPTGLPKPRPTWTVLLLRTSAVVTQTLCLFPSTRELRSPTPLLLPPLTLAQTQRPCPSMGSPTSVPNYLTAKAVPGGTSSATSPGTTKTVAELNIEVGTAFNAATPTAATVQAIRDATNTIFAQAAQRYIAKITLAAHMPGNGMGGSTRATQDITSPAKNPTKGYWKSATWGI